MSNIFKIDFYPHRWLIDTSSLPPEHRGNYIQILMLIYAKEKPIDNDPKWIAGSCGCSSRMVTASIEYLISKGLLILLENGAKITQTRAERELNSKRTYLEGCANGARTTNEKKAESRKERGLTNSERADQTVASTTTSTPTSTSQLSSAAVQESFFQNCFDYITQPVSKSLPSEHVGDSPLARSRLRFRDARSSRR